MKFFFFILLMPFLSVAQWASQGGVNGQVSNDKLGLFNSIATDADGNTMVVGSATNSALGQYFGYAKVLDWNGSQWIQRGQTINGSSLFEGTGKAVDLTADGNTLVVSSPWGFNSLNWKCGVVRVFDWNSTQWIQRGNTIEGEGNTSPAFRGDVFGMDVSITPDGNFLAIGAPSNTKEVGVLQIQGHVRVYQWNGQSWAQMGQDIDGTVGLEEFGRSIEISADGTIVAVGSRSFRTNGTTAEIGSVQTFAWNGTQWNELGVRLTGQGSSDRFGSSVALSNDGLTLAVGNQQTNGGASSIQIFTRNNNTWIPKGSPIIGVVNNIVGSMCSLNSDGSIVGAGFQTANNFEGIAKIAQWNGNDWIQVGSTLVPLSNNNTTAFGSEICLNANGSNVLIGSSSDETVAFNSGRVYMFQNNTLSNDAFHSNNQLEIFPNPTNNFVEINSNQNIDSYSLFSIDGKLIISKKVSNLNQITIDLTELNSGVYLLNINSDRIIINNKIIKN